MREIIKKLLRAYARHKQVKLWKREMRIESKRIKPDNAIKRQIEGRCLVLIPHSDDEWIGCSRIIKEGKDVILCNLDMSGDDTSSLHKRRFEEMSIAARVHGIRMITIKENKSKELKKAIDEIKPDYVFLPHYIDWHPEHIEVMKTLYAAIKEGASGFLVMMYQVSCPIVTGVTHALSMTKEQEESKWLFFKNNYKSQTIIPYQRFAINEAINGSYVGAYAAEVYCEMETKEWLRLIENKMPTQVQVAELKNNLGSITMIRKYIKTSILELQD